MGESFIYSLSKTFLRGLGCLVVLTVLLAIVGWLAVQFTTIVFGIIVVGMAIAIVLLLALLLGTIVEDTFG